MPKRTDIKKILVIGSGPIVIGQACEFDYSGTQACRALRKEGFEVVLVNSNPATIMTDPETADRTYVEPITVESVTRIIERESPDALLPNMGGQTALNCTIGLGEVDTCTWRTAVVDERFEVGKLIAFLTSTTSRSSAATWSPFVPVRTVSFSARQSRTLAWRLLVQTSLTLWKTLSALLLTWDIPWSFAQASPLVAQAAALLIPQKSS